MFQVIWRVSARTRIVIGLAGIITLAQGLTAADGVIEINQASAIAGGVLSGDAPGFPVQINRAGSYILTSNLTNQGTSVTIDITAPGVTLDLNGFAVIGTNTCNRGQMVSCQTSGGAAGIRGQANSVVKNGVVRGARGAGVILGSNSRVERLTVTDSGANGIQCGQCLVTHNTVENNGGNGIDANFHGMATHNTVRFSGARGISVDTGSAVNNRVFVSGTDGIFAAGAMLVQGNHIDGSARAQFAFGIRASGSGIVKDNQVATQEISLDGPILYTGNSAQNIVTANGATAGGPNYCRASSGLCP